MKSTPTDCDDQGNYKSPLKLHIVELPDEISSFSDQSFFMLAEHKLQIYSFSALMFFRVERCRQCRKPLWVGGRVKIHHPTPLIPLYEVELLGLGMI